jgi:hypothetical protein
VLIVTGCPFIDENMPDVKLLQRFLFIRKNRTESVITYTALNFVEKLVRPMKEQKHEVV